MFHALKNMYFSYCFSYAIRRAPYSEGIFPVGNIFNKSKKFTTALSSLLVVYDKGEKGEGKLTNLCCQEHLEVSLVYLS